MDWEVIAPMLVMITGILTTGGVMILRPLSKQLAQLLQVMTQERLGTGRQAGDLTQIRDLLASMESRLSLIEERQGFTESLLEERRMLESSRPAPLPAETARSVRPTG